MPIIPVNEFNTFLDRFIRRGIAGATDSIFPRFMEENAIFTFPLHPVALHWRSQLMEVRSVSGAPGVTLITDPIVPDTQFRYYHAISASHSDAVDRRMTIRIRNQSGIVAAIAEEVLLPQNLSLIVNRPIVVGEDHELLVTVPALGAGDVITLRTYSIQQGLAAPLPGL